MVILIKKSFFLNFFIFLFIKKTRKKGYFPFFDSGYLLTFPIWITLFSP